MSRPRLSSRFLLEIALVGLAEALAFSAAYLVRFDFAIPLEYRTDLALLLPLAVLAKVSISLFFSVHRRPWRYTSLVDAVYILKAGTLGTTILTMLIVLAGFAGFSRAVLVLDWLFFPVLLIGSRAALRLYFENSTRKTSFPKKNVLILGAGQAGQALAKELLTRSGHPYEPVAVLDDDFAKIGMRVQGIPVAGTIADFRKVALQYRVDEAVVAIHKLTSERLSMIFQMAQKAGLQLKRIPRYADLLEDDFSPNQLKNVEVADLLTRSDTHLVTNEMTDFYRGKTIMITGAGGSIGSELVRQVLQWQPRLIICVERNEFNLYELDQELQTLSKDKHFLSVIGDVCDSARIAHLMGTYRPDMVFHAAAYKHVPLMESNASEAVKNNIIGTETVASLAMRYQVGKFVLISTDKAVDPLNVMGFTKRIAELTLEEKFGCSTTKFMAVRFGNVLDSAGSVIPLFRQQIQRGGPITVTHPDIERFFMTIPEAVQLVLNAGEMGVGGEIFVLDMGKPVKIVDLANRMIELSGQPQVQIQFVGLRPGEKLTEALVSDKEKGSPTVHPKIQVILPRKRTEAMVSGWISTLVREIDDMADGEVLASLKDIVQRAEGASPAGDNVVQLKPGQRA